MAGKSVAAVVRLVDQFTQPSKEVQKAAKNLEKQFNNTAKTFEDVGAVFEGVGKGMTAAISVPFAAAGAAAVKFATDAQGAYNQFAASTGTATEAMGKYQDMINNVYKQDFGDSINDVANAMATVNKNMSYLDDSALESVTKYAMTLSDTMEYDVAESTRAADTLISNYGVSAREAFNLISQGAQNGLDYSGELLDTINEYSPQFQKMGFSAEEMFSIFASGAENGAFNLDKIGDAVKEFSVRAVDGSDTTIAGFEQIGLNASEMASKIAAGGDSATEAFQQTIDALAAMDDPVQQNIAGVNLFGSLWEDLTPRVVTSLSTQSKAIDKNRESMKKMMDVKYDSLESALSSLWRTIQTDVLQPIGNMLIPYVELAIDKVGDFVDWWNKLGTSTQQTIVKFGMIAAAVGPALLAFGKVSSGIGGLIKNFGSVAGIITKVSGASGFSGLATMLTGPVGIAISAVAAGAVLVYQNWDRIAPIVDKIKDRFLSFWETVQPSLQMFMDFAGNVASYISENFGPVIQEVFQYTGDFIVGIFDGIGSVIDTFLDLLEGVITFLTGVFTGDWEKAWKGITDMVGTIFGGVADLVKTPINAVINIVNGAIDGINSIHFTVPEWVPGIGGKGWEGLGIPHIPNLYTGTDFWQGGIAAINEPKYGGEIVDLPRGTRVYPHDDSINIAREEGRRQGLTLSIAKLADQIIVREDADIDRIAETIVRKIKDVDLTPEFD